MGIVLAASTSRVLKICAVASCMGHGERCKKALLAEFPYSRKLLTSSYRIIAYHIAIQATLLLNIVAGKDGVKLNGYRSFFLNIEQPLNQC